MDVLLNTRVVREQPHPFPAVKSCYCIMHPSGRWRNVPGWISTSFSGTSAETRSLLHADLIERFIDRFVILKYLDKLRDHEDAFDLFGHVRDHHQAIFILYRCVG